jgi:GNAT superfamily N-acetyltransferase
MTTEVQRVAVEAIRPIRHGVLRPTAPPEHSQYPGDDDPTTLHLGAFVGGVLVGSATLIHQAPAHLPDERHAWRLRGVAVLPQHRGLGLGQQMVRRALEHAQAHGGALLWFFANPPAVDFYLRLGFTLHTTLSNPVPDGPPHPYMWQHLADFSASPDQPQGADGQGER